ncbi:Putative Cell wall mannoprotein [Septoria linicola]|uniref:Cell wall mannoprotein n=1 Tax=Septoria linicola TaxID=215465 RepID=A0A9Q9ENX9_9PEZI|nr:putative Cell wall mannoprotein [Septoria linicola]USW57525.1 Putative Cell wall mannoprotein [Septoria linicola]
MKLLSTLISLSIFLLPTTFAQSTTTPSVNTVYADISTINSRVLALTAATQSYSGGLVNQLPFLIDFGPLYLATRKGFYDSLLLPNPLTASDAQLLISHVNETLAINNPKAVEVVKSKKPLFDEAGTSPVVKEGLELLLFAHLGFSDEVAKRVKDAGQKAEGQRVIDVITVALQDGIAFYSS